MFRRSFLMGALLFGSGLPSGTLRELRGVGKAWVPSRMDSEYRHDDESEDGCRRFEFRRYYPWYRFDAMGSGTPVREALYIGFGCGSWAGEAARTGVENGVYRLNQLKDPVWVMELALPEKRVGIAYRVWKKDASEGEARRIVEEVGRRLELGA